MEQKLQQLTFDKGITDTPSDVLCSDNTLKVYDGLVYRNGEHAPLQEPASYIDNSSMVVLYVHKVGSAVNFIGHMSGRLLWGVRQQLLGVDDAYRIDVRGTLIKNLSNVDDIKITAIGKTLIVNDGELHYFLWKKDKYKMLGNQVPDVNITFGLGREKIIGNGNIDYANLFELVERNDGITSFVLNKQEDAKNALVGLVYSRINKAHEEKSFSFPFWVRYAVRLYDGSYTNISIPILITPTVRYNYNIFSCIDSKTEMCPVRRPGEAWDLANYWLYAQELAYNVSAVYLDDWADIVSGVDIFVSDEVKSFDPNADWEIVNKTNLLKGVSDYKYIYDGTKLLDKISDKVTGGYYALETFYNTHKRLSTYETGFDSEDDCLAIYKPKLLGDAEIMEQLKRNTLFYKIASLKLEELKDGSLKFVSEKMTSYTLASLTTQDRLPDDYYSHCKVTGVQSFAYNNRLILGDIARTFYNGAMQYMTSDRHTGNILYEIYVTILTGDGERVVKNTFVSSEKIYGYFFYPDPRAQRVTVFADGRLLFERALEEHPYLNGSYFLAALPLYNLPATTAAAPPTVDNSPEVMHNQLFVSEVNNPWIFKATGNMTAGMGTVIGLTTITKALSQGQFGQYPLLIFTDEGIWAASMNGEGVFTAVHPMSREVCNSTKSITQTDNAVFFSSEKGLMVVTGGDVQCVSQQLVGSFPHFLRDARIAYDYRDSLLWIGRVDENNVNKIHFWVYDILNGIFSTKDMVYTESGGSKHHAPVKPADDNPVLDFEEITDSEISDYDIINAFRLPDEYADFDYLTKSDIDDEMVFERAPTSAYEILYFDEILEQEDIPESRKILGDTSDIAIEYQGSVFHWEDIPDYEYRIVYDPSRKRFYLQLDFLMMFGEEWNIIYLRSWGDIEHYTGYVDEDNDSHPRSNYIYKTGDFYVWNATSEEMETPSPRLLAEAFYSLHHEQYRHYVVYSTTRKRFMQAVDTRSEFGWQYRWIYLEHWDGDDNYVGNNGHPITGTYYQTTGSPRVFDHFYADGTRQYLWDDSTLTLTDVTVRISAITYALSAPQQFYSVFGAEIIFSNARHRFFVRVDVGGLIGVATHYLYITDWSAIDEHYGTYVNGQGKPSTEAYFRNPGGSYYVYDAVGDVLVITPYYDYETSLLNIINFYPDYLIQQRGIVYSLLNRPSINDDDNVYDAVMETRPMKLENGLALKTIMQIKNVCVVSDEAVFRLRIFASNNLNSWTELHSLRGMPWKYYRFEYTFANLNATDRFSGTMLVTQERRTNKLR